MGKFGIGQPVPRFEDARLLRGEGRFIADVSLPGQAHAVLVRSQHPHARLLAIDARAALRSPGVLAVWTGEDYANDRLGSTAPTIKRARPDGSPMFAPVQPVLARERVRYVGDPVALVVAESLAQARDAAELVEVNYDASPAVTSVTDAVTPGAVKVWDECPDNISNVWEAGDGAAT